MERKDDPVENRTCPICGSNERLSYHAYCKECKAAYERERRAQSKVREENVIVIGGSSGIGAAIAGLCGKRGHDVLTMQRRVRGQSKPLDLRDDPEVVKDAVASAARSHNAQWLVVSGGVGAFTNPLLDMGQLKELTATNWTGVVAALQGFLSYWLRARGDRVARVLYVGSCSERNRSRGVEVYSSVKAAASKYTTEFGCRYAKKGVRANVLATGWTDSPLTADIKPELWQAIVRRIPARRAARVEEIAEMAYSILDGPDYLNGDRIEISGGL